MSDKNSRIPLFRNIGLGSMEAKILDTVLNNPGLYARDIIQLSKSNKKGYECLKRLEEKGFIEIGTVKRKGRVKYVVHPFKIEKGILQYIAYLNKKHKERINKIKEISKILSTGSSEHSVDHHI